MVACIFNHLCDATKESQNHSNNNVPYARLLSKLFHQSRMIGVLKKVSATRDVEETYGKILVVFVLDNMNINKKKDVVEVEVSLSI